ncbi:DUF3413 domain-containing protein [Marinimicrobium agarilyticum]|uniref:DUF3413 domain-containing protein n=1 Tax=Marinimicrobium agarilyticum TaxID=306546 RepID=UPI0003FEED49|nr:DUF3413 domain-containing protein [Marinimicrobium agarilyticum]
MSFLSKSQHSSKERLRWSGWFIVVNSFIAALMGVRYLPWIHIPDVGTGVYVTLAFIAQFSLLAWLFGLPLLLISWLLPARFLRPVAVMLGTLGLSLLLLDTVVYHQFRFHVSSFVIELVMGGGTEIFSFSWLTWVVGITAIVAIALLQWQVARQLWRHSRFRTGLWVPLLLLGTSQLAAHGWNAWADAHYNSRITGVARHLPLYHAATAKRFFNEYGLVDPQQVRDSRMAESLNQSAATSDLDYPKAALHCEPPKATPNLLVVVVDSLRWDMLDPRWMPSTYQFSRQAMTFDRHYSNGNATKPGLFTLFYGLPANYWDAFSAHQQPPVLIQRLQALQYQTKVLASATLVSPAFDRNVFASISDLRLKTPGDTSWQRDIQITDDWLAFTQARSDQHAKAPFFGFLFYDAPHNYEVPPDYPRIQPYWDPVNQLALDNEFDPEPFKNVYKTTVRFVDEQIQRVLSDLEKRQLLENTVVVITSDHGQEFNDNGKNYWGHGSNFTRYQLQVPLVVHWPGKAPRQISEPTEHFDVAPTLMSGLLGCGDTPTEQYATGEGLFASPERDWTIAHSYMNSALLTETLQLVTYPTGGIDLLSQELAPLENTPLPTKIIRQALEEQSRFYP